MQCQSSAELYSVLHSPSLPLPLSPTPCNILDWAKSHRKSLHFYSYSELLKAEPSAKAELLIYVFCFNTEETLATWGFKKN